MNNLTKYAYCIVYCHSRGESRHALWYIWSYLSILIPHFQHKWCFLWDFLINKLPAGSKTCDPLTPGKVHYCTLAGCYYACSGKCDSGYRLTWKILPLNQLLNSRMIQADLKLWSATFPKNVIQLEISNFCSPKYFEWCLHKSCRTLI